MDIDEFDTEDLIDELDTRTLSDYQKEQLVEIARGIDIDIEDEQPDNCIIINGNNVYQITSLADVLKIEAFIKTLK